MVSVRASDAVMWSRRVLAHGGGEPALETAAVAVLVKAYGMNGRGGE